MSVWAAWLASVSRASATACKGRESIVKIFRRGGGLHHVSMLGYLTIGEVGLLFVVVIPDGTTVLTGLDSCSAVIITTNLNLFTTCQ